MTDAEKNLIDWLGYRSYEFNRLNSPHIPYYKWRAIYIDAIQFEDIFIHNHKIIHKEGAWGYDNINK